jgi:plasmid stabilization system protein ParE
MALTLVWTKRAIQGYDEIVRYLQQNWTEREVRNFIRESDVFFALLSEYPEMLQKKAVGTEMCTVAQ